MRNWELSPGGILQPREFLQSVRMGFCCCTSTCEVFSGGTYPASVTLNMDSIPADACTYCPGTQSVECFYDDAATEPDADCTRNYNRFISDIYGGYLEYLVSFSKLTAGGYRIKASSWANSQVYGCFCLVSSVSTGFDYFFRADMSQAGVFQTGQNYVLGNLTTQTLGCDGGDQTACDISSGTVDIDT